MQYIALQKGPIMADTRDCSLNLRISCDLKEALAKAADKDGRTISNYVERVLQAHIDKTKRKR